MTLSATAWDDIEHALQGWVAATSGLPSSNVIWSGYGRRRPTPDGQWISLLVNSAQQDGLAWTDVEDNVLALPPTPCTVDEARRLHSPNHMLVTGDGPMRVQTSGELPVGLTLDTDYWVVVADADSLMLARAFIDAMADEPAVVTLLSVGAGVQTLICTPTTIRAGQEISNVVRMNMRGKLSVQCYGGEPTGTRSPKAILQTVSAAALLPTIRASLESAGVGVSDAGPINDVGAVLSTTKFEPRAHVDFDIWFTAQVSETGTFIETVDVAIETADASALFDVPQR